MLAAVESALDDGLLEHPWHGRDDTVSVARTMEAVLGNMVDKQMAGGSSGRDVGQS